DWKLRPLRFMQLIMKRMNEKEIERWERIRANGRARFIARETVTYLLIMVVAIIAVHLFNRVTGKLEVSSPDYNRDLFLPVIFALYGFVRGHYQWGKQEDRYKASAKPVELT